MAVATNIAGIQILMNAIRSNVIFCCLKIKFFLMKFMICKTNKQIRQAIIKNINIGQGFKIMPSAIKYGSSS